MRFGLDAEGCSRVGEWVGGWGVGGGGGGGGNGTVWVVGWVGRGPGLIPPIPSIGYLGLYKGRVEAGWVAIWIARQQGLQQRD